MVSSSKRTNRKRKATKRKQIPLDVRIAVLTEAGYRCAVPTCRGILALDLHHMEEVSVGGGNTASNLLPLCPTCHALYTRGEIRQESIYTWKSILVSLTKAFDVVALDQLLFLSKLKRNELQISGDGVLSFTRLIAAGLATFQLKARNGPLLLYAVNLTDMANRFVSAWATGNREVVKQVLEQSRRVTKSKSKRR